MSRKNAVSLSRKNANAKAKTNIQYPRKNANANDTQYNYDYDHQWKNAKATSVLIPITYRQGRGGLTFDVVPPSVLSVDGTGDWGSAYHTETQQQHQIFRTIFWT